MQTIFKIQRKFTLLNSHICFINFYKWQLEGFLNGLFIKIIRLIESNINEYDSTTQNPLYNKNY